MDKRSRRDLLSDLPLSIIHSILTFVPIRDAVKTNVLSKQWRYIWATLPHLVFDDGCASDETSLNHFINQALLLHKGPIHKFELSSVGSCCIDQWLLVLSRNDIRMLILKDVNFATWFKIHTSIYSCENLIHLELFKCEIPPPPLTFNGFLFLRRLVLKGVELPCKAIETIVARSPLLEEFTLSKSSGTLELRIHAPNLKYLGVTGVCVEIFSYAPLLSKLSAIFFNGKPENLQQKSSACNYINFLGGFTHIEELSGCLSFIKYLSIGVESYHCSLVFHRLRVIKLSTVSLNDIKEIWVIVRLITAAPNLHKLKITGHTHTPALEGTDAEFEFRGTPAHPSVRLCASKVESLWDSKGAPSFTFKRLKVIDMRNVFGRLHEMEFVKFLLENSPVLETMICKPNSRIKDRQLLTMTAELLRCCRASANAKILFGDIFCP